MPASVRESLSHALSWHGTILELGRSSEQKLEFMKTLTGITISSDAFFPFRDSIDVASRYGVKFVVQPGGSVQDAEVTEACNEYGMAMAFSGVRLFHH